MKNNISASLQKNWFFVLSMSVMVLLPAFAFADVPVGLFDSASRNLPSNEILRIIAYFGIPLVFTILIEGIISVLFLLGLGKKEKILQGLELILGMNLITNPLLNFLLTVVDDVGIISLFLIGILELIVIFVERRMIRYAFGKEFRGAFLWSLVINVGSLVFGLLLIRVLFG